MARKTNQIESKQISKQLTEIVFILDKSGSMSGMEKDTIGGFNSFIEKQRKEDCETLVTTVLFSTDYVLLHDRVNIKKIEPLTENDYQTGGCTALLDAVGKTIYNINLIQNHIRKEDVPGKTIFVITTDGMENSSRDYSYADVKKMISEMQIKKGWTFLFLADNIDAAENAGKIGIAKRYAANYDTKRETQMMYDTVAMYCSLTPDDVDLTDIMEQNRKKSNKQKK